MASVPYTPSSYAIRGTVLFSRALLKYGCSEVKVNGLERFLALLDDGARHKARRGVLTYCNHISVMDEPTLWGCLPKAIARNSETIRWTLGASDIMFQKSSLLARFFRSGQCIETHRGAGIFQAAIDESITKLEQGKWVHLFPEGYVNVTTTSRLRRFKWGISRMLLEAETLPVVVPIWLSGFDRIMPEPRNWPRWMPRLGHPVSINFGEPIQTQLSPVLEAVRKSGSIPEDLLPESLRHPRLTLPKTLAAPDIASASSKPTPPRHQSEWTSPTQPAKTSSHTRLSARATASAEKETLQSAEARSQLAALLRHHLYLVAQQYRTSIGQDPLQDDPLCHTESLMPKHKQHKRTLQDGSSKDVGI